MYNHIKRTDGRRACAESKPSTTQYYFMLRWPDGHVFCGEPLKLCFEDQEEAKAWRDCLVGFVGRYQYSHHASSSPPPHPTQRTCLA